MPGTAPLRNAGETTGAGFAGTRFPDRPGNTGRKEMKRYSEEDLSSTQYFKVKPDQESGTRKVLSIVYEALTKKGYDPVNQIVGYIMSGDPTYITNYMGARSLIMKVERDELVEEILEAYIRNNHWNEEA